MTDKPLELEMRLRNALLKQRRLALGMSCPEIAKAAGVGYQTYLALENLKPDGRALLVDGSWSTAAQALARFHGCDPEELFPDEVLAVQQPVVVAQISANMVRALATPPQGEIMGELPMEASPEDAVEQSEQRDHVRWAMRCLLTPQQRSVVEARLAGDTDLQIAESLGISRARVSQVGIEAVRALRGRHVEQYSRRTMLAVNLARRVKASWLDQETAVWLFNESLGDLDVSMRGRTIDYGYLWPELQAGFRARASHHVTLPACAAAIQRDTRLLASPRLSGQQSLVLRWRFADHRGCHETAAYLGIDVDEARRLELSGAQALRPDLPKEKP